MAGEREIPTTDVDTAASREPRERWYYAREGTTFGPMPLGQLQNLYAAGELRPHDRVWNPKFPEWVDAQDVAHFGAVGPGVTGSAAQGTAATARARAVGPPTFVSDALPLMILGAIVACFCVYFGAVFPAGAAQRARLITPGSVGEADGDEEPSAADTGADVENYGVEICNNTRESRLYVAVAYYDTMRSDWVARGWFPEDQGACRTAVKNLRAPVYVYAESKDGKSKWGDEVSGREFCIANEKAFVVRQKDCGYLGGDRLRRQTFKRLKLNGKGGTHTWDLTE